MSQRKLIGTLVIMMLLVMMGFAGVLLPFSISAPLFMVLLLVSFFITVRIMEWVGSAPQTEEKSRRKVEKVLRELDDDDLDLLRHRLMQDEREEEYGSMAELLQSGKRKNDMR